MSKHGFLNALTTSANSLHEVTKVTPEVGVGVMFLYGTLSLRGKASFDWAGLYRADLNAVK